MKKKIEDSFAMYFLGPKDIFGWIQEICGGPILKEPSFKPELCKDLLRSLYSKKILIKELLFKDLKKID